MCLYRLNCQLTCSSTLSGLGKCDKEVGETMAGFSFLQSTYASNQWFLLVISVLNMLTLALQFVLMKCEPPGLHTSVSMLIHNSMQVTGNFC